MVDKHEEGQISRRALVVMIVAVFLLAMYVMVAQRPLPAGPRRLVLTLLLAFTEAIMVAVIVVSAGGYGFLVFRRLMPATAPLGLRVVTACGLGLWLISTAMLVLGSFVGGSLSVWVWWPLMAVGAGAAMWQGRRRLNEWRPVRHFDGRALLWVVMGALAAVWLSGVTMPPGFIGVGGDHYDVMTYHLQVPREHLENGRIGPLPHNVYSYYPMSGHMLFLLAMVFRGAHQGAYLAKMLHGACGVLAVSAVLLALRGSQPARARFSAGLLASTPLLLYLGWLAMVELGQVLYLAMALLWLRHWLARPTAAVAAVIGAALGAACAVKYLSVGFIVAPILAVMLAACLRRRQALWQLGPCVLAALLLFSPWLIRNTALTGNPVFPLATETLGAGHWDQVSQQRWQAGHSPHHQPPVPTPADYEPPPWPTHLAMFVNHFLINQQFGQITILLAGLALALMASDTKKQDPWNVALLAVLVMQIAVWWAFTRDMPPRFLAPACLPLALLGGEFLARLSAMRKNPFKPHSPPTPTNWGAPPAVALFVAAILVNLAVAHGLFRATTLDAQNAAPLDQVAAQLQDEMFAQTDSLRVLMVGGGAAFYMPPHSIYSTPFDGDWLARRIARGDTAEAVMEELQSLGVTHVLVTWGEIWRLARTYGFAEEIALPLLAQHQAGQRPAIAMLDEMVSLGARAADGVEFTAGVPAWAPPKDQTRKQQWPTYTVYTMPWAVQPATEADAPAETDSAPASPANEPPRADTAPVGG